MASRFLDISAPVARALNTNALIVAIETGFFMRLPYPKNRDALAECEQAFARRACVPCCIGVVDGRLKAGLTREDMDRLCQAGGSCARGDLPALAADHGHMTFRQAAGIAQRANARRLWLTHYSQMIKEPAEYIENARAAFPDAVCGEDGLRIALRFDEE